MMRTLRWAGLVVLVLAAGGLTACSLLDPPPQANFDWTPSNPMARSAITFRDTSSDQGGPFSGAGGVKAWTWDFGDDATSASQNPKHSYQKGDTYTAKLTVTDGSGNTSTVSREVIVTPSLTGLWTGTITDNNYDPWSLQLTLSHSATGGITGTIKIGDTPYPINSASFNPDAGEVQIYSEAFGLVLHGTLNQSQTQMGGYWYDDDTNERGEDWSVTRS